MFASATQSIDKLDPSGWLYELYGAFPAALNDGDPVGTLGSDEVSALWPNQSFTDPPPPCTGLILPSDELAVAFKGAWAVPTAASLLTISVTITRSIAA